MNARERADLDRHITGNWGEDQLRDQPTDDPRIDEALCHETPAHELLSLEREGVIAEGEAKAMLLSAGEGWFDTLLEVESRLIRERRIAANLIYERNALRDEIAKLKREHKMLVDCLEEARDDVEQGKMPSYAYMQRTLAAWGQS